jgi:tetratricopeptide (TPR) repeat protein
MKAIEIDENLAEAHVSLGYVRTSCEWDWPGGKKEFERALEINANDGTARQWYAAYLQSIGRLEEGVAEYRRALEAEPLSMIISTSLGHGLYFARYYDQAIEELRKTINMDPSFVEAQLRLGWVYEQKAMFPEAIAELRQALNGSGEDPRVVSALGHAYAISRQRKQAEELLIRLKAQSQQRYVAPYDIAVVYAGLLEKDQALKYLEMAYEDRSYWMVWLRADPRFDVIRSDPRYQDILLRMHVTP